MGSRIMWSPLSRHLWSLTVSLLAKCVWQVPRDPRESKEVPVDEDQKEVLGSKAKKVFKIKSCDLLIDAHPLKELTTSQSFQISNIDTNVSVHALPLKKF